MRKGSEIKRCESARSKELKGGSVESGVSEEEDWKGQCLIWAVESYDEDYINKLETWHSMLGIGHKANSYIFRK